MAQADVLRFQLVEMDEEFLREAIPPLAVFFLSPYFFDSPGLGHLSVRLQ